MPIGFYFHGPHHSVSFGDREAKQWLANQEVYEGTG